MAPQPGSSQTPPNLEYFTVLYNIVLAIAAIFFGSTALSTALVGFGLGSIAAALSGLIPIWQNRNPVGLTQEAMRTKRRAERVVSAVFFLVGIWLIYASVNRLVMNEPALPTGAGIAIALLAMFVMPVITWRKRVSGHGSGCGALFAGKKEAAASALLPAVLLAGLLYNYVSGYWQADAFAGIVIALILFHRGYQTWCISCGGCECTSG